MQRSKKRILSVLRFLVSVQFIFLTVVAVPAQALAATADTLEADSESETIALNAIKDASVEEKHSDNNINTETLWVKSDEADEQHPDRKRTFIKFDVSNLDLPENVVVSKATVKMYAHDVSGELRTYGLFTVSAEWDEDDVTWNNQPSSNSETFSTVTAGDSENQVSLSWDVTGDVANLLNGSIENHGWLLRDVNETASMGREMKLRSSEYNANRDQNPLLELEYSTPSDSNDNDGNNDGDDGDDGENAEGDDNGGDDIDDGNEGDEDGDDGNNDGDDGDDDSTVREIPITINAPKANTFYNASTWPTVVSVTAGDEDAQVNDVMFAVSDGTNYWNSDSEDWDLDFEDEGIWMSLNHGDGNIWFDGYVPNKDGVFTFKIRAEGENENVTDEEAIGVVLDTVSPEPPTSLEVENDNGAKNGGALKSSWDSSTSEDVDHYMVCWTEENDETSFEPTCENTSDGSTTEHTITGLKNGTSYTVAVTAVDFAGNASDPASTDSTIPKDAGPIFKWVDVGGTVIDVSTLSIVKTKRNLEIRVTPSEGLQQDSEVLAKISFTDLDGNQVDLAPLELKSSNTLPQVFEGIYEVTQNVEGSIKVVISGIDAKGNASEDDLNTFAIKADTFAYQFKNVIVVSSSGGVQIGWDKFPEAVVVDVYRINDDGTETLLGTINGSESYNDSGLTNGKTYKYRLVAKDALGNVSDPYSVVGMPQAPASTIASGSVTVASAQRLAYSSWVDDDSSSTEKKEEVKGTEDNKEIAGSKDETKNDDNSTTKSRWWLWLIFIAIAVYVYYRQRLGKVQVVESSKNNNNAKSKSKNKKK
ncbi:TPA: hypothetical protein DDW69_04005 [candidate division CPR2 bacterium]|uniref:Fibronectin type-III domain-containing protein n=1 Tax=candidate division CPR2 bacterium GW2011_GWC1_41_48 TaxID=1618344 RepID=A0A0G0W7K8_UNCC2|nr:MAG: hypothetical protein UT47_C0003G0011 [candidate division CPR2 bacterium GW2011_GWC2_39_35]KKR29528.1 MAG: hypothetical protein UT59_C0006G0002 [candidate division CPR2 bacterium GW2011_GWD1_39_7]KKS08950.1 MAG: hypothetical protein UU65_C0003G0005 [candidate division CPR2 bacterium GW2011_GWC1_41_48]OGB55741.1 MAG: hypothetical protein A2Y27_01075 [candidate division CPR2 bacterium GWD1_39_7]HBG81973.1 hypothetical protein [candidate division CPR2 bacterium]